MAAPAPQAEPLQQVSPLLQDRDDEITAQGEPRPEKNYDYDALWYAVFEDAEAAKGSFNLIRNSTKLTEITADKFTIVASSPAIVNYVENNRATLEDLMEKHTGARRGLNCIMEEESGCNSKTDVEKIARMAENKLGLNIEIE